LTARSALADALHRVLGLELADFEEAREFLQSPEGSEMLDTWLASRPDDDAPGRAISDRVHLCAASIPERP
jgi:hypothetical protein